MGLFSDNKSSNLNNAVFCRFCGKRDTQVHRLFSGMEDAYICDECVEVCWNILCEKDGSSFESAKNRVSNHSLSSVYNFSGSKSFEEVADDFVVFFTRRFSEQYKLMLFRSGDGENSIKKFTPEEKLSISRRFGGPKIKKSAQYDNIRIITFDSESKEEDFEYEIVDSITKNDVGEKVIVTSIISNGIPEGMNNSDNAAYLDFMTAFIRHMAFLEYVNRGINYLTGYIDNINGVISLQINSDSYSDKYFVYCATCAYIGTIQQCVGKRNTVYKLLFEIHAIDTRECPEFLWDALSRADCRVGMVPDEIAIRYINEFIKH